MGLRKSLVGKHWDHWYDFPRFHVVPPKPYGSIGLGTIWTTKNWHDWRDWPHLHHIRPRTTVQEKQLVTTSELERELQRQLEQRQRELQWQLELPRWFKKLEQIDKY